MTHDLSSEFAPSAAAAAPGDDQFSFARLLKDRIIFVAGPVTMESSLSVVGQLLFLAKNPAAKEKGIDMYIMSPGGAVDGGMAIVDAMNFVKNKGITIRTTAMGLAMSMGSVILVNGSPGHRYCTPSARIMLHEPSGGAQGKTADMNNTVAEAQHMKRSMAALYKLTTKMSEETIEKHILSGPDAYMYGEEAKELGIVDDVAYPDAEHMMGIAEMQQRLSRFHADEKVARKARDNSLFPKP
ncbi:MAG: ATP-dependent Clp protease proteolytic subunit [Alphaproteobacteria bacterium]|nr:ATP-dependent Clp protease proteolytic subunit [Alphaproteobacteria bacterium]